MVTTPKDITSHTTDVKASQLYALIEMYHSSMSRALKSSEELIQLSQMMQPKNNLYRLKEKFKLFLKWFTFDECHQYIVLIVFDILIIIIALLFMY